ncbi:hypothetical protein [Paenarthrobacter ureafaciens]|uniref:hypothetical protein n=1 Tax=Paenarthrobacter ureafaciens TaxID=37931 RepID=UPI002DB63F2D|nr:hypothetical protein [Paenarthrobacter ureafaciens]MEC3851279.1 hypothetical protein [Paenarthrobacter ureafaciens]
MTDLDLPAVCDVDPEYRLQENGKLPKQVEAEMKLIRTLRLNGVVNFVAPTLGAGDALGHQVIAGAVAKHADEGK